MHHQITEFTEKYYKNVDSLKLLEARASYVEQFESINDRVFIYIPTYNRADLLLTRAIPSILSQTHKNFILLVLADACDDQTVQRVMDLNDERVHILNLSFRSFSFPETNENKWFAGPVRAANVALSQVPTHCKWIARIDDDEIWDNDHLEVSLNVANEANLEFVSSGNLEAYHSKPELENLGYHALSDYYYPGQETDYTSPVIGCTSTWLYRSYLSFFKYNPDCWRKAHNKVNDVDFSIRMFEAGVYMGHTGICTVKSIPRDDDDLIGLNAYLGSDK